MTLGSTVVGEVKAEVSMYAQAVESFLGGLLRSRLEQYWDFVVRIYIQPGIVSLVIELKQEKGLMEYFCGWAMLSSR